MADAVFSIEAAVASVLPLPAALQIAASATSAGEFSSGTAAFVGRLDIFWVKIGQEGLLVISVFKLVHSNMNLKIEDCTEHGVAASANRVCCREATKRLYWRDKVLRQENGRLVTVLLSLRILGLCSG